jgi:uncharacterized membrane protein YhaH (DUF805 family)
MTTGGTQPRRQALRDLLAANLLWRGRASRRTLFISIGLLYVLGILTIPLALAQQMLRHDGWAGLVLGGLTVCVGGLAAAFLIGAFVRRLHDRGKRAWWLLLFLGPHVASITVMDRFPPDSTPQLIFLVLGMILDLPLLAWWMVETFLLRGRIGPNRFGDDPVPTSPAQRREGDRPPKPAPAG